MTRFVVRGGKELEGSVRVPGDKSISHRALIVAAMAQGSSVIRNLAPGDDVKSTIRCLTALGVSIDAADAIGVTEAGVVVTSPGIENWSEPSRPLDCGNSGTTMRLLLGALASAGLNVTLIGDESLSRRPMERVAEPLRQLGAQIETTKGYAPISISKAQLRGGYVDTQVPSAQVKSALLLAGLNSSDDVEVFEPAATRDHTERLLVAMGANIKSTGANKWRVGRSKLKTFEMNVPGDPSSAAFCVVAGVLAGAVEVSGVCLNPTRTGFLRVLNQMGADISVEFGDDVFGEPVGTITAHRSELIGCSFEVVPDLIDEATLLAMLGVAAGGVTSFSGGAELRIKESDRIAALAWSLASFGAIVDQNRDRLTVQRGKVLPKVEVDTAGDHRFAMGFATLAAALDGTTTTVTGAEAAAVSWPRFSDTLRELGADLIVE